MTKRGILSKILNLLNIGMPDMSEFDNRLKYQKIIYLLQASDLSLGYGFNWYIKGPYSSPLAHDLFEIDESFFEISSLIEFNNHEQILIKIEDFKKKLGNDIENVDYLEVLASLHYINKATFFGKGSVDNLKNRLLNIKPNLNKIEGIDNLIDKAYTNLSYFS